MVLPTQKNLLFFMFGAGIFALAWFIQSRLLLNWDVSWLLHVTQRLLAGGTYTHDFFEINPPMILYLYIPPILLAKYMGLSIIVTLKIYIFCCAVLSLILCYVLGEKIFLRDDQSVFLTFLISVAISFLILPAYEFGQREHLMLMLIMPYLLSIPCRTQKTTYSPVLACLIGIMAGCGFAIKPYFLITFVLVESYYCLVTKHFFSWIKIETLLILIINIAYVISIIFLQPDYINLVIPIILRTYYNGLTTPLLTLYESLPAQFCCFVLILYFISYKIIYYKTLYTVLALSIIGFFFSYLLQHTSWYYHVFPTFASAVILAALLMCAFIKKCYSVKKDLFYLIPLTSIMLAIPLAYTFFLYTCALLYKKSTEKLIVFLKDHAAHESIYTFSSASIFTFPAIDYAETEIASRTASCGWIRAILKNHDMRAKADMQFFLDMITQDINTKKPKFIFVDGLRNKIYLDNMAFDYLNYFLKDTQFKQAWKNYHYMTTLDNSPNYKFYIYERG